tara:strand:+ start:3327 stop:4484 length:1158 start_codon:yes stop_codon:yes gene_type:complete
MAVLSFAAISAIGILALSQTGDSEFSSPKMVVGLFSDKPPVALPLKDRLNTAALDHTDPHAAEDDHLSPNLGVADPDEPVSENAHGEEEESEPAETVQIAADESHTGLPKAPFEGMTEWSAQGKLPVIADDGRKSFEVYRRPFSNPAGRPTISIVVGGLGLNARVTQAAIDELDPNITLSFVPYSRGLQTWVDKARAAGHEVLIELPMEPYDYPNNDTGPYTLLTTATAQENLRRTEWLLSRATGYFGVTNYQGAKYATDSRAITPIFEELQQRGLAFIHDGSAPRSVFEASAKSTSLPFAEAARVIDSDPQGAAIDEQLLHLEAIALQRGYALGTGFAFPITIDQLRDWSATLESKGYLLAPASALPRTAPAYNVDTERQQGLP